MKVPRDPAMPRLGVLLDPDGVAPLLERSLGRPARLGAVRIARVSYKPRERVTVHYRVVLDGRGRDAVARAVAGRDLERRTRRHRAVELARRVDGRSPALTPIVYDADADALITWLPFDLRLPALAETPPHARLLSYRPGRRAVLRLDDRVLKVYGSARQFALAAAGLRAGSALHGIATPRCEAIVAPLRLTEQAAIDGEPVSSLEAASEAGAIVRRLQRATVPPLAAAPREAQLDTVRRKAALIGAVVPALAGRVEQLVRRLGESLPGPVRLVPAHGDFYGGQLLRARDGLVVLDLDGMCLGSPALDLAEYAAAAESDAALDALLEGYGARPDGLAWDLTAATFVRASHPFHCALPAWPDRIEEAVGAAEAVLAGSARR